MRKELPNKQENGNVFNNKCMLMESILKSKAEKAIEKTISDQFEAMRAKNKASRERKHARREERLARDLLREKHLLLSLNLLLLHLHLNQQRLLYTWDVDYLEIASVGALELNFF